MSKAPLTYLPQGVYPKAARELIRLCQEYVRRAALSDHQATYPFNEHRAQEATRGYLHALSVDLTRISGLEKSNWIAERPRLQLHLETDGNEFRMSVFPSPDAIVRSRDGIAGITDMANFRYSHGRSFYDNLPVYPTVLRWTCCDTDIRMLHSDAPWEHLRSQLYEYSRNNWSASPREVSFLHTSEGFALRRRLLKLSHDVVLHRMSLMFQCTLSDSLVCFGPDALISLHRHDSRRVSEVDEDEQEERNAGSPVAQARLAPTVAALIKSRGVRESDMSGFLTAYLNKSVPQALHVQTLTDYLGLRERHKVTAELLESVQDELDEDKKAQRLAAAYISDPESLRKSKDTARWYWPDKLERDLRMDREQLHAWLLVHFQDEFDKLNVGLEGLRELYDNRKQHKIPADKVKQLVVRLHKGLSQMQIGGRNSEALARLNTTAAQLFGFEDLASLSDWTNTARALAPLKATLLALILKSVERQGRTALEAQKKAQRTARYLEEKKLMSKPQVAR